MGMSKNRRRAPLPQQKADPNVAVVVGNTAPQQPAMMPRNMRAYIQEGYRSSKTVFRVVGHIARAGSTIKWKHYTDETKEREIDAGQSELLKLWNMPAPRVAGTAFREAMIAYYAMTGNNYIYGINASKNPKAKFDELYNLRPDLTKIKVNENGPEYYEFGTFQPPKRYDPLQIMHNKLFAGNDDVYGLSPVEVAAMLVDIQKAGQKWNLGLLSNMARPGGAWVTDALLGDTEYKGLKKEIRDKFAGPRNAGETAILHGGVKWQSMSMSPYELDWLESDTKGDRDIAGIFFNFPTFLLGLADATFNNQAEAKHFLYTDIVFPIMDMFVGSLNMWLTPRYGGYLDYDKEDVETIRERLQEAKAVESDRAGNEFAGGTSTFHETRTIQGKEQLPNKDFVLLQQVPVFVDQLDDYIQAQMDKVLNPPPPSPPLQLPPTKITEVPDGTDGTEGDDGNDVSKSKQKMLPAPRMRLWEYAKALDLTTPEQKQNYLKKMESQRIKWETTITERVADYFKDEQKTVLASLPDSVDPGQAQTKAMHALDVVQQSGALKHLIVSLYQDVNTDVGTDTLKELKYEYRPFQTKDDDSTDLNLYAPDVLVYLYSLAAQKVTQITDTTRAEIQSALAQGVQAGEALPALVKRLNDLYLVSIIPKRSEVIARTEVIAASNYGSQEAAKSSGLTLKKVWLSTSDSRTRPDHAEADGQEVDMDEPFKVGGSQLMYPGDSSLGAPADEVVSCRCTQYYRRVKEDTSKSIPPAREVSRDYYRELLRAK